MKYKITLISSFVTVLIITTITGVSVSLYQCIQWNDYCGNSAVPPSTMKFTQGMISHAYYWMGIALICVCLIMALLIWYLYRQHKIHPEWLGLITTETMESYFKKIKVNIHTNEIITDGITLQSSHQVVVLLDHLIKSNSHEISYTELNSVFHEAFYDDSSASKRKINKLKYDMNETLKNIGFELIKTSSDKLTLVANKKKTR